MIEQSFSDFGDADAVILVNNQGDKEAVFIEAKVKTSQKPYWSILEEFEDFKIGILEIGVTFPGLRLKNSAKNIVWE
ncbi:MAG: hypothetical protein SCAL_000729 [Candidatus Syntrophoarchaeum caldarius]|uniref:Uncharacterized protein n=1 Tax=Candidatus Syntropharchaeum caldarium TaxID=1838285 RepID=A0A1F2P9M2_9EURY|nr:MAG: hypothetical protein SCAL_000729 [Candidatus Syntrophoarchaeum caldarius]